MLKTLLQNIRVWFLDRLEKAQEIQSGTEGYVEKDAEHYARLGWMVLLIGFGGFMLWAMFAPLDKGQRW